MIVYGYNSSRIGTYTLPNEECPYCKAQGTTSAHTFASYVHLFWIPFFPYKKYAVSHCSACNRTQEDGQLYGSLRTTVDKVKEESKLPVWHFSGLFIVGIAFIYFSFAS